MTESANDDFDIPVLISKILEWRKHGKVKLREQEKRSGAKGSRESLGTGEAYVRSTEMLEKIVNTRDEKVFTFTLVDYFVILFTITFSALQVDNSLSNQNSESKEFFLRKNVP